MPVINLNIIVIYFFAKIYYIQQYPIFLFNSCDFLSTRRNFRNLSTKNREAFRNFECRFNRAALYVFLYAFTHLLLHATPCIREDILNTESKETINQYCLNSELRIHFPIIVLFRYLWKLEQCSCLIQKDTFY